MQIVFMEGPSEGLPVTQPRQKEVLFIAARPSPTRRDERNPMK
jgi:hypothetical protein